MKRHGGVTKDTKGYKVSLLVYQDMWIVTNDALFVLQEVSRLSDCCVF